MMRGAARWARRAHREGALVRAVRAGAGAAASVGVRRRFIGGFAAADELGGDHGRG